MSVTLGAVRKLNGVEFTVWAPHRKSVSVVLHSKNKEFPLHKNRRGYFKGRIHGLGHGALYKYRLDGKEMYPDPCSRFQPEGPHGPSMVVDPKKFKWNDASWKGVRMRGQVIYEMHVGLFTKEGTFDAAIRKFEQLKWLGVTTIEVMPVNEFSGRYGWGYDGVDLYAPSHLYGDHNAFKRFVDAAHRLKLGVILDVVYNHLGPDGNYLSAFSPYYFSEKHKTEWGQAINFDDTKFVSEAREFFIQNAEYWIREFHLDGLRLDATQNIYDDSPDHILGDITDRCRAAAGNRQIILTAENADQNVRLVAPRKRGYGLDAIWVDDFHHASRISMTGIREAYLQDYCGSPQEYVSLFKYNMLFQGQYQSWVDKPVGTRVIDEPAESFIFFLQNHDQVANGLKGDRISTLIKEDLYRAYAMINLLAPQTPLIFMGQEYGETAPFTFFADLPDLAPYIMRGRAQHLAQFPTYKRNIRAMPDPNLEATYHSCRLSEHVREEGKRLLLFHRDLLKIRREEPLIARQSRKDLDGAVLGEKTFVIRYFGDREDALLLVNLGSPVSLKSLPEPLMAPGKGRQWSCRFRSDAQIYGGRESDFAFSSTWQIPGFSAYLLKTVFS